MADLPLRQAGTGGTTDDGGGDDTGTNTDTTTDTSDNGSSGGDPGAAPSPDPSASPAPDPAEAPRGARRAVEQAPSSGSETNTGADADTNTDADPGGSTGDRGGARRAVDQAPGSVSDPEPTPEHEPTQPDPEPSSSVSPEQDRALRGIGVEGTQDDGYRAPDASDKPTLREQEAMEDQEEALRGVGFEGTREDGFRAPESGEETFREREQREKTMDTLEGIGVEGTPDDGFRAPSAPRYEVTEQPAQDAPSPSEWEEMTPMEKLGADVPDDEPAPIEFLRGEDGGETQFALFATKDEAPSDRRITFGEAFATQFATPDTDITDSLTASEGLFDDETERQRLERAQEKADFWGVGEEANELVTPFLGETAGNFAEGLGSVPGELAASTELIPVMADTGVETAENVGATAEEYGTDETWDAIGETFGAAAVGIAQDAQENPARFAGSAVADIALGSAAFKALDTLPNARRTGQLSTRRSVDYEDITTKAGTQGELPRFDTDPDAPTQEAVDEISERARDNPDVVTEQTGGSTLFHGTQSRFDSLLEVGEGASELPGLFTSPDASPIALQGLASDVSLSSFKPRLPSMSSRGERFLGLPGDEVAGMAPGATGAANAVRRSDGELVETGMGRGAAKSMAADDPDLEVVPDPTTTGYQFLDESAEPGTAYVRPSGGRTTELEAIFPPESRFEKTGHLAVTVGRRRFPGTDYSIPFTGRRVPLDTFRRADTESGVPGDVADLETIGTGGVATAESLATDMTRLSPQEGSATVGGGLAGGAFGLDASPTATEPTPDATTPTGVPDDSDAGLAPDTSAPEPSSSVSGSEGSVFDSVGAFSPSTGLTTPDVESTSTPTGSDSSSPTGTSPFGGSGFESPASSTGGPPSTGSPPPTSPPGSGPPSSLPPTGSSVFSPGRGTPTGSPPTPTGSSMGPFDTPAPTPPPTSPRGSDSGRRRDEDELPVGEFDAETPLFWNPIASGADALFGGDAGGDTDGFNPFF